MTYSAVDQDGNGYNKGLLMVIILIGAFCIVMNQTLLTTAYPTIMKDMNITLSTVQWLTTSFLLVSGIVIPLSAYLMNRIHSKYLFIIALLFFFIGSVICYVASNFSLLLFGRIAQGVAAGIALPFTQTCVLHMFEKKERGVAMGMVGLVVGLAPAVGPTLSGYIVDSDSWKLLFLLTMPFIILDLFFTVIYFKKIIPLRKESLDILSVIFSSIGFGMLLYGISIISSKGFSKETMASIAIGLIALCLFVQRELTVTDPLLDLNILTYQVFSISVLLSCLSYMALLGFESILPDFIQIVHGKSAFQSGLMLLPGALVMGFMSPVTGKIFDKRGGTVLIPLGLFLLSIGTFPFIFIKADTQTILISLFYGIRLFGISMVLMPITTIGMNALPSDKLSNGTALNNTLRQIASSIGTAILVSTLSHTVRKNGTSLTSPQKLQDAQLKLDGYRMAFLVAFIFCLIALITSLILFSKTRLKTKQVAD